MSKIDFGSRPDRRQGSADGMKQGICIEIIHRFEPSLFEDALKSLDNTKIWAIRREKGKKQSSSLPQGTKLPHKPASVYTCIVKDYKGPSADTERHTVRKVNDLIRSHVLCYSGSLISTPMVYHTEYIEPGVFLRGDVNIFTAELLNV